MMKDNGCAPISDFTEHHQLLPLCDSAQRFRPISTGRMAKRKRDSLEESTEDRAERKRLKKEDKADKKRKKKEEKRIVKEEEHLDGSDDDDGSQGNAFFQKKIELTVSLLPCSLGDVVKHIEDSLRMFLLKYSDGIQGILLAFDNVKLLGKGTILDDFPHIHYDVAFDALVFCPTVGYQLTGLVTESSFHSHLSLVVHRYFNASISAEQMRQAGFEFDDGLEQWYWKDETSSGTLPLTEDDPITFVCDKIHESGGIISLAGFQPSMS
jgi:DNA-directed RNA polymerase subunit E'/Rpb7